jgi:hypothetical protein
MKDLIAVYMDDSSQNSLGATLSPDGTAQVQGNRVMPGI